MLGIFLTLLAVLFVFCVAFYTSERPGSRSHASEQIFFDKPVKGKNRGLSR